MNNYIIKIKKINHRLNSNFQEENILIVFVKNYTFLLPCK